MAISQGKRHDLAVVSDSPLFPDVARRDPQPKRAHESDYGFFQRVDDPACNPIRDLLSEWFERFASLQDSEAVADPRQRDGLQRALRVWIDSER